MVEAVDTLHGKFPLSSTHRLKSKPRTDRWTWRVGHDVTIRVPRRWVWNPIKWSSQFIILTALASPSCVWRCRRARVGADCVPASGRAAGVGLGETLRRWTRSGYLTDPCTDENNKLKAQVQWYVRQIHLMCTWFVHLGKIFFKTDDITQTFFLSFLWSSKNILNHAKCNEKRKNQVPTSNYKRVQKSFFC